MKKKISRIFAVSRFESRFVTDTLFRVRSTNIVRKQQMRQISSLSNFRVHLWIVYPVSRPAYKSDAIEVSISNLMS